MRLRTRVTLESGLGCCPFEEMWGEAERLLGHPIWNHEFIMESIWEDLHIALVAEDEGAFYHPVRVLGPLDTLRLVAPDKPIFAVVVDDP